MHRLFIALRPPAAIRALLIAAMGGVSGARWQRDDQLHLTVRYIGEVDGGQAESVADALAALHARAVTAAIAGVGQFTGSSGRPNALWAGVRPHEPLAALHHKVDRAMTAAGLPPERRAYLPHVTLARLGSAAGPADGFLVAQAALSSPPFTMDALVLFESHLGHDGANYREVTRVALG